MTEILLLQYICKFITTFSYFIQKLYYCNNKKKDFQQENQNYCGKLHLDATHFVKLFISLTITNSYRGTL